MVIVALVLIATPLLPQSAVDFYKTGRAQMDSSAPEAAVKSFERATALDNTHAEYHFWLGRAMGFSAQTANILRRPFLAHHIKAEFERALQLDSLSVDAHEGLAMYYTRAPGIFGGSLAKAREQAKLISRLSPLRGHFARAALAIEEKNRDDADAEFAAALTENPDSLTVVVTYADYLTTVGRADAAFTVVDAYLGRHPGDVPATFWIGRIASISGKQLDRGEKALRMVLETPSLGLQPPQPLPFLVHYRLGMIAAKAGNKDAARAEFGKALELNAKYDAAKKALKAL